MAVSSKTVGIVAGAVVVVGVGGYLGAQAFVGSEVEKSLEQAFTRLDASPSWRVTDVHIDKSLFDTRATATLEMVAYEGVTADVDLLVDHGVFQSPVTGTILPNEALFSGVIDIDMVASLSGVEGQLSADTLGLLEADGEINGAVMDLSFNDEQRWRFDLRSDDILLTDPPTEMTYRLISPSATMDARESEEGVLRQRLHIPRLELLTQGVTLYMADVAFEAVNERIDDTSLMNQSAYLTVDDMGVDDTPMGRFSLNMPAENLDMQGLQDFSKAYLPLEQMQQTREEDPSAVDEARYREHLIGAIEGGYEILNKSPTLAIDPLEAHIVLPEMGLDFKPRLTAQIRFDGEGLSKQALYSAVRDRDLALPAAVDEGADTLTEAQALEQLFERLYMSVSVSTPPEEAMMLIPMPFSFMLDPALEQQTLTVERGEVTLNGETLM
ncbi:DUF945 family protein [Vreelandella sp. TE19]